MRRATILSLLSAVMLLSPVLTGDARAQKQSANSPPALHTGAWALQFQIDDNFQLSPFQGAVLSLKHHYSDRSAVRLGLGVSLDSKDFDATASEQDSLLRKEERDDSSQFVRLDLQYIRYTDPASPVKMLLGGGPFASLSNSDHERKLEPSSIKNESTSWVAGLSGLVGVEWFPASMISLHAEYGIEFYYRRDKTTSETIAPVRRSSEQTGNTFDLRAKGVLFGLSAYF